MASAKTAGNHVLIIIMWLLLCPPATQAQTTGDKAVPPLPARVDMRIEANPRKATIGDPIRIQLDITMPQGYQAQVSRPVAKTGDFFVMDFSSGPIPPPEGASAPAKSGPTRAETTVRHRTQITVAVYKTGKFDIPAIPVKITTKDGKEIAAESPSAAIEIRSILTEKNPALKDLKKQAEIQEPARWHLWVCLAVAGGAICGIIWYLRRRRRSTPLPITPEQTQSLLDLAEADLRNLIARGLPGGGEEKSFYIALSEIVKRILEAGYRIHTAEHTTSEIMNLMDVRADLDSGNRMMIEDFLSRCDVVKFAKYVPAIKEHETATQIALQILAEARNAVGSRQSAADGRL